MITRKCLPITVGAYFMVVIGPDFKSGFVDQGPVSNADLGKPLARLLKQGIAGKGSLIRRVTEQVMPGGAPTGRSAAASSMAP